MEKESGGINRRHGAGTNPGTPPDAADERIDKIIDAAMRSFSLFGYKGTTVDQIAKIAGVGKGTIYLFFENKEELLHELIRRLAAEMKEQADGAIRNRTTVFERLHAAFTVVLQFRKEHEVLIKLSDEVRVFGTPAAREALLHIEDEVIGYIRRLLEEAAHSGRLAADDPEAAAFVIYKMYVALVYEWEKRRPAMSDERIAALLENYLLNGLLRGPNSPNGPNISRE